MGMADVFFTNLDSDFSETIKVHGTLSKNSENDNYIFIQEGKEDTKEYFSAYNTLLFLVRRYMLFAVFFVVLLSLFVLASPLFAGATVFFNFLLYLIAQPFSSKNRMARVNLLIKVIGVVAFIISAFVLFSNTMPFGKMLDISQGLLYGFIVTYVTFYATGLWYKYRTMYIRLEHEDDEVYFSRDSVFLWKST